jgi:hypothetical protein
MDSETLRFLLSRENRTGRETAVESNRGGLGVFNAQP